MFKSFGKNQKSPIETCFRIEQPSVIKFLVAEGCKAVEIHRRMSTVYGSICFIKNKHKELTQGTNIENKRRGHQSKGVLHHDNARPHTAAQTVQTINKLDWKLLPHPLYCPDFHLFGSLNEFTRGTSLKMTMKSKVL